MLWLMLDAVTGRALVLVENGGDRYCLPDLMRQKSLARYGRGDVQGAWQWMEQALALTATMGCHVLMPRLRRDADRVALPASSRTAYRQPAE